MTVLLNGDVTTIYLAAKTDKVYDNYYTHRLQFSLQRNRYWITAKYGVHLSRNSIKLQIESAALGEVHREKQVGAGPPTRGNADNTA